MTPKRMLAGALLLLSVVAQPALSSPYVLIRQASPLLYPASYPSTSSQVTLNNGLYSPWSSFYYPSVITQRNPATAGLQAPATLQALGALQAPGARATNTPAGCGTWTSSDAGCYKHFVELKSWQAAREQCREEGRREGVSDADLAYLKPTETERNKVITDLVITSDQSLWLNGKLTKSGAVTLKDSTWEEINIPDTEWIEGKAPTFDLNQRNLFIKTKEKKLGADPGVFTSKGFICEFKKRVCKDSTWKYDSDNQRCLKVSEEEKTYQNAKVACETESSDSTLASLVPSKGTKLKEMIISSKNFGTWVLESASKDATGKLQFTKPKRGIATGSDPVTMAFGNWKIDQPYQATLTTVSRHLSLNSAGGLVPVFDSNAKAHFICQHAPGSSSGNVEKQLARSLLSFNQNV